MVEYLKSIYKWNNFKYLFQRTSVYSKVIGRFIQPHQNKSSKDLNILDGVLDSQFLNSTAPLVGKSINFPVLHMRMHHTELIATL